MFELTLPVISNMKHTFSEKLNLYENTDNTGTHLGKFKTKQNIKIVTSLPQKIHTNNDYILYSLPCTQHCLLIKVMLS